MEHLPHFFTQQTTPLELLNFVVAVVAICVLIAGAIYWALMSGIWAVGFRGNGVTYGDVFLPSVKRLKTFGWDYVLAGATSVVLAVTIADKHDIVDRVLDHQMTAAELAKGFPWRVFPDESDLGDGGAGRMQDLRTFLEETGRQRTTATVVKPLLEAGQADAAKSIVVNILADVMEERPALAAMIRRGLMLASVVLIVAYLLTMAYKRSKALKEDSGGAAEYRGTLRHLMTAALCVALLLASPAVATDADLLAQSAIGAIEHSEPDEDDAEIAEIVQEGIEAQYVQLQRIRVLAGTEGDGTIAAQLGALNRRLLDTERGHGDLLARLDTVDGALDSLRTGHAGIRSLAEALDADGSERDGRIDALEAAFRDLDERVSATEELPQRIESLEALTAEHDMAIKRAIDEHRALLGRLTSLAQTVANLRGRVDSLHALALLIVDGATGLSYTVSRDNREVESGEAPSGHWLPAGEYTVTVVQVPSTAVFRAGQPRQARATLLPGRAAVVRLGVRQ